MPREWATLLNERALREQAQKARAAHKKKRRRGRPPIEVSEMEKPGTQSLHEIRWRDHNGHWHQGFDKILPDKDKGPRETIFGPRPDQIPGLPEAIRAVCALLKQESLLEDAMVRFWLDHHQCKQLIYNQEARPDLDAREGNKRRGKAS